MSSPTPQSSPSLLLGLLLTSLQAPAALARGLVHLLRVLPTPVARIISALAVASVSLTAFLLLFLLTSLLSLLDLWLSCLSALASLILPMPSIRDWSQRLGEDFRRSARETAEDLQMDTSSFPAQDTSFLGLVVWIAWNVLTTEIDRLGKEATRERQRFPSNGSTPPCGKQPDGHDSGHFNNSTSHGFRAHEGSQSSSNSRD